MKMVSLLIIVPIIWPVPLITNLAVKICRCVRREVSQTRVRRLVPLILFISCFRNLFSNSW